MAVIHSKINTHSQEFKDNSAQMSVLVDDWSQRVAKVKQGGGEKYQQRHKSRGKLLARGRVDA